MPAKVVIGPNTVKACSSSSKNPSGSSSNKNASSSVDAKFSCVANHLVFFSVKYEKHDNNVQNRSHRVPRRFIPNVLQLITMIPW
uniref:Uncharacterized protein n=1 Tax=Globodera rostochiensis TaxID=31243 RepID=A0A914IE13_GLORO